MAERKDGYYWVRDSVKWLVAEWDGEGWWERADDGPWPDAVYAEIGPRVERPQE